METLVDPRIFDRVFHCDKCHQALTLTANNYWACPMGHGRLVGTVAMIDRCFQVKKIESLEIGKIFDLQTKWMKEEKMIEQSQRLFILRTLKALGYR